MASIQTRISQDGKKSYRVQVRLKGYETQTGTFERKTDATRWANETEASIRSGQHFKNSEAKLHTVAEAIDRFLGDVEATNPRALPDFKSQLAWWRGEVGSYTLADLTPAVISSCRDKLLRGVTIRNKPRSPARVLRYINVLSSVLNKAVRDWGWLDISPTAKVSKPRTSRLRIRFLDDDERERLLEVCGESESPYLHVVVVLALSTGMRQGEIMKMRWEDLRLDVSKDRGRLVLHETKNGERRPVYLFGRALDLLRKHKAEYRVRHNLSGGKLTGLVFPSLKVGDLSVPMDLRTPWETARKKAALKDFRFHDLRHCTASYLAMNGATLADIAEVLGHKTLAMVKRYAHLSESHVAGVVERMNKRFF